MVSGLQKDWLCFSHLPCPSHSQLCSAKSRIKNAASERFAIKKQPYYIKIRLNIPLSHSTKGSTLYDIGWGQKMMLHCSGEGLPTGMRINI